MNSSVSLPLISTTRSSKKRSTGSLTKHGASNAQLGSSAQIPLVHRLITHSSKLTDEIQSLKIENENLRRTVKNAYEMFYSTDDGPTKPQLPEETEEDPSSVISRFCVLNSIKVNNSKIRAYYGIPDRNTAAKNAATVIQKYARGRQRRIRYSSLKNEIIKWRQRHQSSFINAILAWVDHQEKLNTGWNVLKNDISTRTVDKSFKNWKRITVRNLPFRRQCRAISEARFQEKLAQLLQICFKAWKKYAIGPESQQHMRQVRKDIKNAARENAITKMREKGELDIVPSDNLLSLEYYRECVNFMRKYHLSTMKKEVFGLLRKNMADNAKKLKLASDYRFKKEVGRIFYAWSEWVYEVSTGLDREHWPAPRKFEVQYNVRAVTCFTRTRLLKYVFFPWRRVAHKYAIASRKFRAKRTKFLKSHLVEWRLTTKRCRQVKRKVLDRWENAKKFELQLYFRFWLSESHEIMKVAEIQNTLVNAHLRCRMRRLMSVIFKTWKHQTVYGRIDGMYTRLGLLQSLSEQKSICSNLELLSIRQAKTVEDMNEIVSTREKKILEFEQLLCSKESDFQAIKMALHNSEQEMCRLKGIIEAARIVAPAIMAKLYSFEESSGFKNRNELYDLAKEPEQIMQMSIEFVNARNAAQAPVVQVEVAEVIEAPKEEKVDIAGKTWDSFNLEAHAKQRNVAERAIAAIEASAARNMPQVKQVLNDITDAVDSRLAERILQVTEDH